MMPMDNDMIEATPSDTRAAGVYVRRLRRSHLLNVLLALALTLLSAMRLMESCDTTVRYQTEDGLAEASIRADEQAARFDLRLAHGPDAGARPKGDIRMVATGEGARLELGARQGGPDGPEGGGGANRATLDVTPTEARLGLTFGDGSNASTGSISTNQSGSGATLCRSPDDCIRLGVEATSSFIRMARGETGDVVSLVQDPASATVTLSNAHGEIVLRVGPDEEGGPRIVLSASSGAGVEIGPEAIVFRDAGGQESGRVDAASCPPLFRDRRMVP